LRALIDAANAASVTAVAAQMFNKFMKRIMPGDEWR
jgi:hypothetical protein